MMGKYLKESLHWLHLALFKPITLAAETRGLTSRQAVLLYLGVLPVQLAVVLSVIAFVGTLSEAAGIGFKWSDALVLAVIAVLVSGAFAGLAGGLIFGLAFGLAIGLSGGLVFGLGIALRGGLGFGLGGGLVTFSVSGGLFERLLFGVSRGGLVVGSLDGGLGFGLLMGLLVGLGSARSVNSRGGLIGRLGVGPIEELGSGLGIGLVLGLLFGLQVGLLDGLTNALHFGLAYSGGFAFAYLRFLHIVPYAIQRWRSREAADPFSFFRNSPVYWDEAIAIPLPFLSDWLVNLVRCDRERGMSEIANVARLPYQRRAAQRAVVKLIVDDLQRANSFEKIASAPEVLAILPSDAEYLPKGLDDVARHLRRVAELASDYLTRVTPVGQVSVLGELRVVVESFREAMVLIKPPVGPTFQSAASRWLEIVKAEEAECRKRMAFEPIPNPFVAGNPLMVRDKNLFKGRTDIIVAIEENIINPAQRPALLLYGRRRIGKTSTLLNLPRLLSSKFVPVFIDCQDAKWREGDEAFCYHLAAAIHNALNQRSLVETAHRPRLERFERYAFTRLGEYLDQIEETSRAAHKQILLTFDEYERLEVGVNGAKITTEVFNQLRTIVQHRERIVVLFSGGHRFEEMSTVNWSDYLINVKTLELSFLAPEDARELITEPVPLLQYESGVIEQIIEMTHCQPYLLQAVASDLVNYLNSEQRMLATAADLGVAVEKVLVTAQSYFFYTWTGDCTETEREVLRMIAVGDSGNRALAADQASLQSLCHKEILERHASSYRFSIELFRRWVLKNQTAQPFTPGDLSEPAELEYAAS